MDDDANECAPSVGIFSATESLYIFISFYAFFIKLFLLFPEHMNYAPESLLSSHLRMARKLRDELNSSQIAAAVFADVNKMVSQKLEI